MLIYLHVIKCTYTHKYLRLQSMCLLQSILKYWRGIACVSMCVLIIDAHACMCVLLHFLFFISSSFFSSFSFNIVTQNKTKEKSSLLLLPHVQWWLVSRRRIQEITSDASHIAEHGLERKMRIEEEVKKRKRE